jgi:prevent-host-death family protein
MPARDAKARGARSAQTTWKLEDAKARFSEVVRRAHAEGPQAVTVRGRRAVVVLDAEEYERLAAPAPAIPLVSFLEGLDMSGLDLTREADAGRDIDL